MKCFMDGGRRIVIAAFFHIPNIFRDHKVCETRRCSSTKTFATVRQNSFDGKSWYFYSLPTCPLLSIKIFDTWNFLNYRRGPLRHFLALSDKTISTENRDCPRPCRPWKFSIPEKVWNTAVFLYKMFRDRETKKLDLKSWYPPFIHKIFP